MLVPVLADALALVALLLWLPGLATRLQTPSGTNALLLTLTYVLFCVGVFLLRKLMPAATGGRGAPPAVFGNRRVRALLALLFALLMVSALAFQLGYFAVFDEVTIGYLDEGSSSAFFALAPGAWLMFAMVYILVLAFTVTPAVAPGRPRYAIQALLALVMTHTLFVYSVGQLRALLLLAGGGSLGTALASAVLLLLGFLPPRLVYQEKLPQWVGLVSFGVLVAVAVAMGNG